VSSPFINRSEALREAIDLLQRLVDEGNELLVRVHPGDRIENYTREWVRRFGRVPASVRFSKGGSLDPILQETDVAVMYISTVFLNCVASGIPVINLAWYRGWLQEASGVDQFVHFAETMDGTLNLIARLSEGDGRMRIDSSVLLAPSPLQDSGFATP
jgi:hypothetical protein